MKRWVLKIPVLFLALAVVSCASGPDLKKARAGREGEFALLAEGALAYFYVDVSAARSLLRNVPLAGMGGGQAAEVLDRTGSAVIALYPGGERRFLVAARGTYPSTRAGISFAFSPDWKRVRSVTGNRYWRSSKNKLSLVLGPDQALLSDGDPFTPPPGTEAPSGFEEIRRNALLAGWTDTAEAVNRFIAAMAIPITIPADRILFGIYAAPRDRTRYEAKLRVQTATVSQARALVSIFSMARLFIAGVEFSGPEGMVAAALFANVPVQEGSDLIITTGLLDAEGITLLFNMFSLYSIQTESFH
jgi:hypothetical protein